MLLICDMVVVALAVVLGCWCIVLYCNAPYMPAPLIAGNSRGFTDVSRGAAAAADGEAAGTMPKTSFGLGGNMVVVVDSRRRINASWPRRSMMYLKNSYVDQQMAVAGIEYNTLGSMPRKKPLTPAVSRI